MKEFLDNLYKHCAANVNLGVDDLYDVMPKLLHERKFDVVDSILQDIDLERVNTGVVYTLIHLVSSYIHQLPHYRPVYQRAREACARAGKSSDEIAKLFDRYENGSDRLFDPAVPERKSPEVQSEEKLTAAIARAKDLNDKDTLDFLTFYQSTLLREKEKRDKFFDLRNSLGEPELRRRAILSLREMADLLENNSGSWPGIYYCDLPEDPLLKETFIDGIEVVISYPWPG